MRVRARRKLLLGTAMLFAVSGAGARAEALPGSTSRESVASSRSQASGHTPATSVPDEGPAISLDGRTIAFSSDAADLVAGDTNGVADVFVRSLPTGKTVRASLSVRGGQADGASHSPALSVDGRYLAFVSAATNLVPGDTNGVADVFVRDLRYGRTTRVSVAADGAQANGPSARPFVSLFGRWITFDSAATNLVPDDTNGLSDAFLRDVSLKRTERLAAPPIEKLQSHHDPVLWTAHAQVSYDGRFVSFTRGATGYARDAASPAALDTYVLDRVTRKSARIPAPAYGGRLPNGMIVPCRQMSDYAAISADGQRIAVEAWSACGTLHVELHEPRENRKLGEADTHPLVRNPVDPKKILLFDTYRLFDPKKQQSPSVLSINSWNQLANGDSTRPVISANGQMVAFASDATNLVAGDTNGATDVFVRDRAGRTTSRISLSSSGGEANGRSWAPSMSYEGRQVIFASEATNLAGADTNFGLDVYRRDRRIDTPNSAPNLLPPISGTRKINALEPVRLALRAIDKDRDPLRFGVILGMPQGARIDPVTGVFEWTPSPSQTGEFKLVFWVDDPRGASDVELSKIYVRDAQQTARCRFLNQCDA